MFAFPFKVMERTTRDAMFSELLEIIENEKVGDIVIGLPLSLDGEDTLTTRQVRNFAASLERRVDLPIHLVDEDSAQLQRKTNSRRPDFGTGKERRIWTARQRK